MVGNGYSKFIYFIQCGGDDGPIKIGVTSDPALRLKRLQTGSPHQLRLLGTIRGDEMKERRYHEHLAAHRTRGEWFAPHVDVLACIPAAIPDRPMTFEESGALLDAVIERKRLEAKLSI